MGKGTGVPTGSPEDIGAGAGLLVQRQERLGRGACPAGSLAKAVCQALVHSRHPREMARTNQHIDGQTHHQAHMQQSWQPAGPRRSLLLCFPHPKAKPDYRTLWSQGWQ